MAAGEGGGRGGSEREGDVVLLRPPPQLQLPARGRVFPEAATGSGQEQLWCSAILCLLLPIPRPSAAAAELTVSPEWSGAFPSRRGPASVLRAPSRVAAPGLGDSACGSAGRGARRRLSRDALGHFCPVMNWRRQGSLPLRVAWVICGLPGGGELRVVRPGEELGVFLEGCNDGPGAGVHGGNRG